MKVKMEQTITPKADRGRELTHAETIVVTNGEGVQLCRPKYGCNWSINEPTGEGTILTHWIGEELAIKAQWNANYIDTPIEEDEGESVWDW